MRAICVITVFLLAQALCYGKDSAYKALRIAGGNDQALLNHVIEVDGLRGDPQPMAWRIVVDDPAARGGIRELEVSNGRVVSEHTPVRGYAGTSSGMAMDFKRLNLDSEGAFTIANQEATKRNTGFDSVDYLLRSDEQTNAPVWVLRLLDTKNVNVGTLYISADNGAVLRTEGFGGPHPVAQATAYPYSDTGVPPSNVPPSNVPPPNAPPPANAPQPPPADNGDDNAPPPGQGVGYQINKGIHRFGADIQQFFTGKRTWDQRFQNDQ